MYSLQVFSTRATDKFFDVQGQLLTTRSGGPAYFIQSALDQLQTPYQLNLAPDMEVDIVLSGSTETGTVVTPSSSQSICPQVGFSAILLSTLLGEWLPLVANTPLFIDLQGFARNCRQSRVVEPLTFSSGLSPFCVKGTQSEISQLNSEFLADQKQRQLIITRGTGPISLFISGQEYQVTPKEVPNLPDTVGAGDTWFSAYISFWLQNLSPLDCAQQACLFTSNFLASKAYV